MSIFTGAGKGARILITRTDRLGDVLLATPVLARVREAYPDAKIFFLVQKAWMPVLQLPGVELVEYRPDESMSALSQRLLALQLDAAIVIRDEPLVSNAVRKAKIPVRVGPYSSLRSFFCFNHGKFQRRSRCERHEAEYNLDLLTKIGIPAREPAKDAGELPHSWIRYAEETKTTVKKWLDEKGLIPGNYFCFHPGSSGSARYLSTEIMADLVKKIMRRGHKLVLTGGAHEAALLTEIMHSENASIIFGGSEGAHTLDELAELYKNASVVIAHGTGPMHLAAAVSTPTFGIFSPLHVLSEKRWGPLVAKRFVWVPPLVDCPEKYRCRGVKCGYYDCMSRFEVEQAVTTLENLKDR